MIPLGEIIKNDLDNSITNIEYLVKINTPTPIYIASRKQMFEIDGELKYFEDYDIRIPSITDKIDLRNKKIQLSSLNVTLTNFTVNNSRLSDLLEQAMGVEFEIYLKTQNCKDIGDCARISVQKISRITHDSKKVVLHGNDAFYDNFYINLPGDKYLLSEEENTLNHFDQRYVPILYGHLQNAPAVIYLEYLEEENYMHNNGIKVIPDISYLGDNEFEIGGIKSYFMASSHGGYVERDKCDMINPDVLKIKIGKFAATVMPLPYINSRSIHSGAEGYSTFHTFPAGVPQFNSNQDHVEIVTHSDSLPISSFGVVSNQTMPSKKAFWLSYAQKPISSKAYVYQLSENYKEGSAYTYQVSFDDNAEQMKSINTCYFPSETYENGQGEHVYRFGVQTFEFEPISGMAIFDDDPRRVKHIFDEDGTEVIDTIELDMYRPDVHFVGDLTIKQEAWEWDGEAGDCDSEIYSEVNPECLYILPGYSKIDEELGIMDILKEATTLLTTGGNDYNVDTEPKGRYGGSFPFNSGDFHNMILWHRRCVFAVSGYANEDMMQYVSYFDCRSVPANDPNSFESEFRNVHPKYQILDATSLTLNYMIISPRTSDEDSQNNEHGGLGMIPEGVGFRPRYGLSIDYARWSNFYLRKIWCNKDAFSKDLFLNARGRVGGLETYKGNPVEKINQAVISIRYACVEEDIPEFGDPNGFNDVDDDDGGGFSGNQNLPIDNNHISILYKYLTEPELKYKLDVNGNVYEIMLAGNNGSDEEQYFFDIDLCNIRKVGGEAGHGLTTSGKTSYVYQQDVDYEATHDVGWSVDITSKFTDNFTQGSEFNGFRLIYGLRTYDTPGNINYITPMPEGNLPPDIQDFNDLNGYSSSTAHDASAYYNGLSWIDNLSANDNSKVLLEKPPEILKDIAENLLGVSDFDETKYSYAYQASNNERLAFSIESDTNSRKIVESIMNQSRLIFRYRMRDKKAIIESFKNEYSEQDLSKKIDVNNILSYNYSKTKIDDLGVGGTRVLYNYDYITKKTISSTEDKKIESDEEIQAYRTHYGLDELDKYQIEVSAPYINNEATANKFRDYLYEMFKHQHLLVNFKLPLKDGIDLEVGDIIEFSGDPGGVKPYGRKINQSYILINQVATKYFMITKISKDTKSVSIEAYQTHKLFSSQLSQTLAGDANVDGVVDESDLELVGDYIAGNAELSAVGFLNADVAPSAVYPFVMGNVDILDYLWIANFIEEGTMLADDFVLGDVDGNGVVDANDYILAMRHVHLGSYWLNQEQINRGDVDGDGVVTQEDCDAINDIIVANGGTAYEFQLGDVGLDGVADQYDLNAMTPGMYEEGNNPGEFLLSLIDFDGDGMFTAHDLSSWWRYVDGVQYDPGAIPGALHPVSTGGDYEDYELLRDHVNGYYYSAGGVYVDYFELGELQINSVYSYGQVNSHYFDTLGKDNTSLEDILYVMGYILNENGIFVDELGWQVEGEPLYGDANNDGSIDSADLCMYIGMINGSIDYVESADIDGDGVVSNWDLASMLANEMYYANTQLGLTGCSPGDFNCDGTVNNQDLEMVAEFASLDSVEKIVYINGNGISLQGYANCDFNGDGIIDQDDVDALEELLSTPQSLRPRPRPPAQPENVEQVIPYDQKPPGMINVPEQDQILSATITVDSSNIQTYANDIRVLIQNQVIATEDIHPFAPSVTMVDLVGNYIGNSSTNPEYRLGGYRVMLICSELGLENMVTYWEVGNIFSYATMSSITLVNGSDGNGNQVLPSDISNITNVSVQIVSIGSYVDGVWQYEDVT